MKETVAVDHVPGSCTIFSASIDGKVLFGNNEDYTNSQTYYWTEPANSENYGCLYLGFENYSHQGGINEKGLCFDANALPSAKINLHPELVTTPFYEPPYNDFAVWAPVLMLRKASNVKEAISIAKKYQRSNWYPESGNLNYQINLADSAGDAAVISVDLNGELTFTRKKTTDKYLVSTNFNRANPENAFDYPCERYNLASQMLSQLKTENLLTVDYFKSILDSTHVEGIFTNTLYSNIFDLSEKNVFLYHWHQFDEVVVLNVDEELAKGRITVEIESLFSQETVRNASREYIISITIYFISILIGIMTLLVTISYFKKRKRSALTFK